MNQVIDLRSDTVTRPTPAMKEAMMTAVVGDDVFAEDPTVNRLQERLAALFGKEDSLFVPSGVMGNQICLKVHTLPGDEVICERDSHVFVYETGAPSLISGVQLRTVEGINGAITVEKLEQEIRQQIYYLPRTSLLWLENTHTRAGGKIYPFELLKSNYQWAKSKGIAVHLDGARIWNASVASGVELKAYAACCDSMTVCFSKGLGAPIGSAILGSNEFIRKARKVRKILGGGMRQCGYLAAAALYAMDNHFPRLSQDHDNARLLAQELKKINILDSNPTNVETNIIMIGVRGGGRWNAYDLVEKLTMAGLLVLAENGNSIRAVTHLDVSREEIEKAVKIFEKVTANE